MDIQVVSSLLLLQIILQSKKFANLHICKYVSKVEMLGQRAMPFSFPFFRKAREESLLK